MEKKRNLCDYCTRIVAGICVVFCAYIMTHFIAVNICSEMFGMSNAFVNHFTKMDVSSNEEENNDPAPKVKINWSKIYPFEEEAHSVGLEKKLNSTMDKYLSTVENAESKIDTYSNTVLPGKDVMVKTADTLKTMIGYDLQLAKVRSAILYMQNGYLAFAQPEVPQEDIEEIADSILDFKEYLGEKNIPFLYANTGSKVCPTDRQLSFETTENTNEMVDALQAALDERNVEYVDFRQEILDAGFDWYKCFYRADHHWTTQTGLWVAKILAEKLNAEYGFSFDVSRYELSNFTQEEFKDVWVGTQGRIDAFVRSDVEDFTLLTPKFETDLTLQIPSQGVDLRGAYTESLLDLNFLEQAKAYTREDMLIKPNIYYVNRLRNNDFSRIINHLPTNNDGKKILFIYDSFAWYATSFLATDVSAIDVIYPKRFKGSIHAYIEENKPDMVVMMYNARMIGEINWNSHLDGFDLR